MEHVKNVAGVIVIVAMLVYLIRSISKRRAKEARKKSEEREKNFQRTKIRQTQMRIIGQRKGGIEGELIDYSVYKLSVREWLFAVMAAGSVFGLLGYIFYEKWLIVLLAAALGLIYPRFYRKTLLERRKNVLNIQFKEAVQSLSASLAAGRSAESSFEEVAYDLKLLYPDPNTYILKEFDIINRRVENGEALERAIEDFAQRACIEDIANFSDVFNTCKRTGGSLVEVMRRTADIISDKISMQQDLKVLVSQKKFEAQILNVMPIGMVLMLKMMSADYLSPLYDWSGAGPLVMTVSLALLVGAFLLGQKIMAIKL